VAAGAGGAPAILPARRYCAPGSLFEDATVTSGFSYRKLFSAAWTDRQAASAKTDTQIRSIVFSL
jgi:hypothetical protein